MTFPNEICPDVSEVCKLLQELRRQYPSERLGWLIVQAISEYQEKKMLAYVSDGFLIEALKHKLS